MKLHGLVWIIVGAIVSGFSKFIQGLKPDAKMDIFFYVGLAFVAFGVFKLIVRYITSDKKQKPRKTSLREENIKIRAAGFIAKDLKNINIDQNIIKQRQEIEERIKQKSTGSNIPQNQVQRNQNQNSRQSQQQGTHIQQNSQNQRIFCQRCGNPNYAQANFCSKCGSRLR